MLLPLVHCRSLATSQARMVQRDSISTREIIAITGFLDEERVKHFLLAESVNEQLTASDLETMEDLVIPLFTGTVFSCCYKYGPSYSIDIASNTELYENASRCPFFKNKEGTLNKA